MVTPSTDNQTPVEKQFVGTDQDWLAIIESLSDSITLIDQEGAVLFTNHQNHSANAEVLVGDSIYAQFQPSHQETLRKYVDQVFQIGSPVRFEMGDASGDLPSWQSFLVKPFRDAQQITRAIIVKTDITEQKLAEEYLRSHEIQMVETHRLASIAQLVAGVGHEINNPLSVIQGYTEVLLGGSQSEDVRLQLNNVLVASQRISKIVKELNQLARHTQPTKIRVNINTIVEQAIHLNQHDSENNKIQVINRVSNTLPHATADSYQLIQAILNILTNAQQSITALDRAGEIIITSSQDSAYIKLHITDNGSGIDPAHISQVFDPFFTTHEIGESAGLGLSVSYSITRQNSGKLWVESVLGQGSTFHLELPIESVARNEG